MNIYEKINKIQVELKAPKSQRNNFGNYNFRNCEDILEALKPLLLREKMIIQLSDELVQIGDRFYITLCLFLSIAINTTLPLVACVLRVYYTGDF